MEREAALKGPKGSEPPSKPTDCMARLIDYPWGLMNPSANKDEALKLTEYAGMIRGVRQVPSLTVWGLAVHGKSGTPFFDSHGVHAADYIYQIPQGNGLPPDYYLCDSRVNPQACALIGGNLRHACAEWYDPFACHFCEDKGDSLQCEVRGWSHRLKEWARVPIYPRDLLGELYRGEFYNTVDRPLFASINIPKAELQAGVKEMPWYMQETLEPLDAVEAAGDGVTLPPWGGNPFVQTGWDPIPIFLPPSLRPESQQPKSAQRPHHAQSSWCSRPARQSRASARKCRVSNFL